MSTLKSELDLFVEKAERLQDFAKSAEERNEINLSDKQRIIRGLRIIRKKIAQLQVITGH